MRLRLTALGFLLVFFVCDARLDGGEQQEARIQELLQRVQALEQRVQELESLLGPMKQELLARGRAKSLRVKFNERSTRDRQTYTREQLHEIETLYQVANEKWRTPEAKESLQTLIDRYSEANRTGCALLYLGQMSQGEEKEKYLRQAISDFSDCWYGDGVQVGAYARLHLAGYYQRQDKDKEAKQLYQELRDRFPDAIDHNGNLLCDIIPKQ